MSVKVPYETVQYQSHHHCQCDYCNSRRTVNAKKFGVSQTIAQLQTTGRKNNCCCSCHEVLASRTHGDGSGAAPSFELDDPEHHVNQTALNASNGRVGIPGGDRYTIAANASGRAKNGGSLSESKKTQEELEKAAVEDLDRLERLLILEHKARVKATMDTENAQTKMETGKGPRPIPFDPSAEQQQQQQQSVDYRTPSQQEEAQPPRMANGSNGLRSPPPSSVHSSAPNGTKGAKETTLTNNTLAKSTPKNFFGPRPEGAGVVWRKIKASIPEDMSTGVGGIGNVDNRDLWQSTLVKGTTVKKNGVDKTTTAPAVTATVAAPTVAEEFKLSPGAQAAIQQQQEQQKCFTNGCGPQQTV